MPLGVFELLRDGSENKQVINQRDGNILGPVSDIEADTARAEAVIIVFGRPKCMGCSDDATI